MNYSDRIFLEKEKECMERDYMIKLEITNSLINRFEWIVKNIIKNNTSNVKSCEIVRCSIKDFIYNQYSYTYPGLLINELNIEIINSKCQMKCDLQLNYFDKVIVKKVCKFLTKDEIIGKLFNSVMSEAINAVVHKDEDKADRCTKLLHSFIK